MEKWIFAISMIVFVGVFWIWITSDLGGNVEPSMYYYLSEDIGTYNISQEDVDNFSYDSNYKIFTNSNLDFPNTTFNRVKRSLRYNKNIFIYSNETKREETSEKDYYTFDYIIKVTDFNDTELPIDYYYSMLKNTSGNNFILFYIQLRSAYLDPEEIELAQQRGKYHFQNISSQFGMSPNLDDISFIGMP